MNIMTPLSRWGVKTRLLAIVSTLAVVLAVNLMLTPDASARGRSGAATVECNLGDSLQDALDKGFDGMTFNVSGTCNEVITIELNNVIIDGRGLGPDPIPRGTISCDADCLALTSDNPGLVLVRGSNVLIKNMTIRDGNFSGVAVQLSSSVVLKRNVIVNNDQHGVIVTSGSHAFIGSFIGSHTMPDDSASPKFAVGVEGNIIKNNDGSGVVIRLGAAADVFHNQILDNAGDGISLSNGGSADIDGNDIDGNDVGISLVTNSSMRLDDDAFHGKIGGGDLGNVLNNNNTGIECKIGAAMSGNAPTGSNGASAGDNVGSTSGCHIASVLNANLTTWDTP